MVDDNQDRMAGFAEAVRRREALERVVRRLSGKVLRRTDPTVGGGVSGVVSTSQKKYGLFLYPDQTFRYEVTEFASVSSGGFGPQSQDTRTGSGDWAAEMMDGKPALVLKQEGAVSKWWHIEDGGPNVEYLGGERWDRYIIRK